MPELDLKQESPVYIEVASDPVDIPVLTRKETMKSSLKVHRPNLVRASSEPPPLKTVHFSTTNLEDIRPFNRLQSPAAVRRGRQLKCELDPRTSSASESDSESDADSDDSDADDEDEDDKNQWTLLTPGFAPHAMSLVSRAQRPIVYLDSVQLTNERKAVKAAIYVRNICFKKYVAIRYTLDGWRSFGESQGVWSSDVRKFDRDSGYDRFDVLVPLNQFNEQTLNSNCIQACVRFVAEDGAEYWDNHGGKNYELYLRNPHLSSRMASIPAPNLRQKSQSLLSLPSYLDNDDDDDDRYNLSTGDYLKRVGINTRNNNTKHKELFDRYSFASSYKSVPPETPQKKNTSGYLVPESHCSSPPKADLPGRLTPNSPETARSPPSEIWESDSYKDFISRYCFFTPNFLEEQKQPPVANDQQDHLNGIVRSVVPN